MLQHQNRGTCKITMVRACYCEKHAWITRVTMLFFLFGIFIFNVGSNVVEGRGKGPEI